MQKAHRHLRALMLLMILIPILILILTVVVLVVVILTVIAIVPSVAVPDRITEEDAKSPLRRRQATTISFTSPNNRLDYELLTVCPLPI
jgi:hypothetical protein